MQPTLVLSAAHPGILYINGRFAGELSPTLPLFRPTAPQGALYLEFKPLNNRCEALARRLVFSSGTPMQASVEEAENLNVVLWPGNVTEIEFAPPEHTEPTRSIQLGGRSFLLEPGGRLLCDGRDLGVLPEGASLPELASVPHGAALTGNCAEGRYLLTCDENFERRTGFLHARQLDVEPDGRVRAIAAPGDLVGHATLENWRLTSEGLSLISSEPAWAQGAPRWPGTPEETVRCAVEAALEGLEAEAEGYLSPALRSRNPLQGIRERCDLCVEMKYAPPEGRSCVGLFSMLGVNLAQVHPLCYRTSPSGGPQGPYLIEALEFG